jgi:hypothetical protein
MRNADATRDCLRLNPLTSGECTLTLPIWFRSNSEMAENNRVEFSSCSQNMMSADFDQKLLLIFSGMSHRFERALRLREFDYFG